MSFATGGLLSGKRSPSLALGKWAGSQRTVNLERLELLTAHRLDVSPAA